MKTGRPLCDRLTPPAIAAIKAFLAKAPKNELQPA
jgi:hypothetical protein